MGKTCGEQLRKVVGRSFSIVMSVDFVVNINNTAVLLWLSRNIHTTRWVPLYKMLIMILLKLMYILRLPLQIYLIRRYKFLALSILRRLVVILCSLYF